MPQLIESLARDEGGWCTNEDRRASPRYPATGRAVCRLVGAPVTTSSMASTIASITGFAIAVFHRMME